MLNVDDNDDHIEVSCAPSKYAPREEENSTNFNDDQHGKDGQAVGNRGEIWTSQQKFEEVLRRLHWVAYSIILLSFFFFCWSVLSFVIFPPLLALYGLLCFPTSFLLGCFFLSERVTVSDFKHRVLSVISCFLNFIYCLISASAGLDEGYDEGAVAFAAISSLIWLLLGYFSYRTLGQVIQQQDDILEDKELT